MGPQIIFPKGEGEQEQAAVTDPGEDFPAQRPPLLERQRERQRNRDSLSYRRRDPSLLFAFGFPVSPLLSSLAAVRCSLNRPSRRRGVQSSRHHVIFGMRLPVLAGVAVAFCFSGGVLSPAEAAKKSTPAPTATQGDLDSPSTTTIRSGAASSLLRWQGGGEDEAKESWLSAVALKIKQHSPSAGSNRAKVAWKEYEIRKSELTRNPDDPHLQLDTAEALLKWIRHTTNGNFPRVSAEGKVCDGDTPASRAIWRKHAPEALRLLKTGATHALESGSSDGGYDLAKVRESGVHWTAAVINGGYNPL